MPNNENDHHCSRSKAEASATDTSIGTGFVMGGGFKFIRDDTEMAEDLFTIALKHNPNSFEALMGIVCAYLNRLEQIDDQSSMVIGFYLLRKDGRNWIMEQESMDATLRYIAYLDKAIENAPEDMMEKLRLFRQYKVYDSKVLVDKMLRGDSD